MIVFPFNTSSTITLKLHTLLGSGLGHINNGNVYVVRSNHRGSLKPLDDYLPYFARSSVISSSYVIV